MSDGLELGRDERLLEGLSELSNRLELGADDGPKEGLSELSDGLELGRDEGYVFHDVPHYLWYYLLYIFHHGER